MLSSVVHFLFSGARRDTDTSLDWQQKFVTLLVSFATPPLGGLFIALSDASTFNAVHFIIMVWAAFAIVTYFYSRIHGSWTVSPTALVLQWTIWMAAAGFLSIATSGSPGSLMIMVCLFFLYGLSGLASYAIPALWVILAAVVSLIAEERRSSFGLYKFSVAKTDILVSKNSTTGDLKVSTEDLFLFWRGAIFAVGIPLVVIWALQLTLQRIRRNQQQNEVVVKATTLFAEKVAVYDTRGGSHVVEDHAEVLPEELSRVFQEIINNLDQYRPFLPAALQPNTNLARSNSMSLASESFATLTVNVSMSHPNPLIAEMATFEDNDDAADRASSVSTESDQVLVPRATPAVVAMLHVEVNPNDPPEAQAVFVAGVITNVTKLARDYGGYLRNSIGLDCMITWAAVGGRAPHRQIAQFCCALRAAFTKHSVTPSTSPLEAAAAPCQVSCAIAVGLLVAGVAGDEDSKHIFAMGPFDKNGLGVELGILFEAAKYHNGIFITQELAEMLTGSHHTRAVDVVGPELGAGTIAPLVASPKTPATMDAMSFRVCEVVSALDAQSTKEATEWMYALQQGSTGVCEVMNRAVEKYSLGHYEEASRVLEVLTNAQRQDPRLLVLEGLVAQFLKSNGSTVKYCHRFGWY